jgi:hypothetical protein
MRILDSKGRVELSGTIGESRKMKTDRNNWFSAIKLTGMMLSKGVRGQELVACLEDAGCMQIRKT